MPQSKKRKDTRGKLVHYQTGPFSTANLRPCVLSFVLAAGGAIAACRQVAARS
jgi:hypothetical protein